MTARPNSLRPRVLAAGVALAFGAAALPAPAQGLSQDPPARAGRIAYLTGPVSLSPSGSDAWAQAALNRPLVAGDRLWTDAGGRDEAQFGPVVARMDAGTLMSVLAADEGATQLQVSQGRIDLHVRRIDPNAAIEVDTPNLAFVARAPGDYRIVVNPDGSGTDVAVLRGGGDVYGDGNAYAIGAGQGYRFAGQDLQNIGNAPVQPYDAFDRWAFDRDARLDRAQSARFVPADVVGYEDLDDNGAWRVVPDYGSVWVPTRVAADWAPYRSGHWAWIDPWGWTWVDDQPWGYAVSHYGRWVNLEQRWAWVPAPARERPVFAPALVAFVGAALALGGRGDGPGVGWFPLGPHEPYRPPYHASPAYVTRINVSNTPFGRGGPGDFLGHPERIRYANRGVPGALMAMPAAQFAGAAPVGRAGRALDPHMALNAPLTLGPGARPSAQSRIGTALARQRPPEAAQRRLAVARSVPAGFGGPGRPGGARFAQGGGRPDFGPRPVVPVRMLRPATAVRAGVPPSHGAGAAQVAGHVGMAPGSAPGRFGGPGQQGLAALPGRGATEAPGRLPPANAPYPGRGEGAGAGAAAAARGPERQAFPHGTAPQQGTGREHAMPAWAPAGANTVHEAHEAHGPREAHASPQARPMQAERGHVTEAAQADGAHGITREPAAFRPEPRRETAQPRHDEQPAFQPHREPMQPHRDAGPAFQAQREAQAQHHEAPPQQHHESPPAPQQQHHESPPAPQHHDAPHPQPAPQQHHDAPPPQHQGGGGDGHGHEHEHGH